MRKSLWVLTIVTSICMLALVYGTLSRSRQSPIATPNSLKSQSPKLTPTPIPESVNTPATPLPATSTTKSTPAKLTASKITELRRELMKARRDFAEKDTATDDCSRLLSRVTSHQVTLDNTSLRSLTHSVLKELDIPLSSQLLVFSGSASQGTAVNPRNPRAIYFNDESYVGIVPGGLLEMIGVDAESGAKLYTFGNVGRVEPPTYVFDDNCMRCHGGEQSGYVGGFFMRFSYPEMTGRMKSVRNSLPGHQRPLSDRFGGWHVTNIHHQAFPPAGQIMNQGVAVQTKIGEHYTTDIHLEESSDILAHLLHEHQIGFHNRLIKVVISARDNGQVAEQQITSSHDEDIEELIGYMLFKNEAKLPQGGIKGDPRYAEDFRRNRRLSRTGASLKDFDLQTRLLKYRCSYMIYTKPWRDMPAEVNAELITRLHQALQSSNDPQASHLPEFERLQILHILRDTLPDLPDDW